MNYQTFDCEPGLLIDLAWAQIYTNYFRGREMTMVPSSLALTGPARAWLEPLGLRSRLMLFYQPPGDMDPLAHLDLVTETDPHYYSLNCILKGQGEMQWYRRPPQGGQLWHHPHSPQHVIYETYPNMQLEQIDSWRQGRVALVNTGTPHGVVNPDPEARLCISIRFENMGWDQAVESIENFIKENRP